MSKLLKTILFVIAIVTMGVGTIKTYNSYNHVTNDEFLLTENVIAFSESDEKMYELCASMAARSSVTSGGVTGSSCPSGTTVSDNPSPTGTLLKCEGDGSAFYYDVESKFGYCYRDVIRNN